MDEQNKMKIITRLMNEIEDIKEYLNKDEKDGYLLRPYVRRRLEDRLQTLIEEERDLNNNIFSEN